MKRSFLRDTTMVFASLVTTGANSTAKADDCLVSMHKGSIYYRDDMKQRINDSIMGASENLCLVI